MSHALPVERDGLHVVPLPWDSDMLGISCGLLDLESVSVSLTAQHVVQGCGAIFSDRSECEFTTLKLPSRLSALVNDFHSLGARYVVTEFLMVREPAKTAIESDADVRFVKELRGSGLDALGPQLSWSRFFRDRRIPVRKAQRLLKTSVANALEGRNDMLAVGFVRDVPAGLIVLRRTAKKRMALQVVGVLRQFRNQGVGTALLQAVAGRYGPELTLEVETHPDNAAALALYAKAGFRLRDVRHIMHFWRSERRHGKSMPGSVERTTMPTAAKGV